MRDFLDEIRHAEPIPGDMLAYIGARLCSLFHQAILSEFEKAETSRGLTKRKLARRIGKKPEQITRWLSYPGNLTLDTAAEILVGIGVEVESLRLANLANGVRVEFPPYTQEEITDRPQPHFKITHSESTIEPLRKVGRQRMPHGPRPGYQRPIITPIGGQH